MGLRTALLAAAAVILVGTVAGCTSSVGGPSAVSSPAPTRSPAATAVTATGAGTTDGAKTQPGPISVIVPIPAGAHGVEVTVSCVGSGEWFAVDTTSSIARHGHCDDRSATLLPVSSKGTTTRTATLAVNAGTGGRGFTVRAIATSRQFRQDAALASFCKAVSTPDSTLYNADISYQKHLSTAAQWQQARTTGAAQLDAVARAETAPAWASHAASAIRSAVLTAPTGRADVADSTDDNRIATGCENNDSTITITDDVRGQG